MEKPIEQYMQPIIATIETVLAIEVLEYHDKNYLSGDNASRSREKQEMLACIITDMQKLKSSK